MIGWFYLGGAILFEVVGTTAMKLSEGLTRFWPSVTIFVTYGVSFVLLTFCLKHMDVSLAYAIWAGLGTALIAVIGVLLFKEPLSWQKVLFLGLIIAGVIGLEMSHASH